MGCSMLRGFLKILVLKALGEGPKSGYALMKYVQDHVGSKPSAGSMYPLLDHLSQDNLITIKKKTNSNEYQLTEKGNSTLKDIEEKRNQCLTNFIEGMKMLNALTGENMEFPISIVEGLKHGVVPFKDINPEMDELRHALFKMTKDGTIKKNAPKIRRIIANAKKELMAL